MRVYMHVCVPYIHTHGERDFKQLAHVILEPWQVRSARGRPAAGSPREEPQLEPKAACVVEGDLLS